MTTETLTLIVLHFMCSDIAEERMLTHDEVQNCSAVYQQVKLAFIPETDASGFHALSPGERIAMNKAGFVAYHNWLQTHPALVAHLRRVARGEEELAEAS